MRNLARNKQVIYYSLLESVTETTDEYGNKTGTFTKVYATPQILRANISPAKGNAGFYPFGIDTQYSKVLIVDDMNCPIAVDSILWIGKSTDEAHNYVVTQMAVSLNCIQYAVKEVKTS